MSCIIEFFYVLPKGAPPLNIIFQKSGPFERKERRSFERGSLSSIGALSSKYGICTFSLYELALLQSQTTWITQVLSHKSFNVRPTLVIKVFWASMVLQPLTYERSNWQLPSQSTLKENYGNAKSINYDCTKFSKQSSFFLLYCHIYRTPHDINNL